MAADDAAFAAMVQQQFDRGHVGFAVTPITTCPHIPTAITPKAFVDSPCESCDEMQENWQCLTCDTVRCSRYRHGHMLEHFEQTKDHSVCLSYSDLSVWCFICESYVVLDDVKHAAYVAKFGEAPPASSHLVVQSQDNGADSSSAAGASSSSSDISHP